MDSSQISQYAVHSVSASCMCVNHYMYHDPTTFRPHTFTDGEAPVLHIVGPSRLEPPRGCKPNLCSCGRIFMIFSSFDLKSSSESNGHGLKFLKFQERVELEPDITKGPQEKILPPSCSPCCADSKFCLFVIAKKII